jgi:glycosyltransferase involved in cell wall biosynthesis
MRVLMVNHVPFDAFLGASRPQLEIARRLVAAGHTVDKYSVNDAFPKLRRTRLGHLVRRPFSAVAVPAIKRLAASYDIIDANHGDLPVSKHALGFGGRLIVRSNGLRPLYRQFVWESQARWPDAKGHVVRRLIDHARAPLEDRAIAQSLRHADSVIVTNRVEADYIENWVHIKQPVNVIPLGVGCDYLEATAPVPGAHRERLKVPSVVVIGTWDVRKGSRDWPALISGLATAIPGIRISFLGTGKPRQEVLRELGPAGTARIDVQARFSSEALPGLLREGTAGALPSYLDSFGLGVLETLAAGIPCVAYDSPGPRETLGPIDRGLLVPIGDTTGLTSALTRILTSPLDDYVSLAQRSRARAEGLTWDRTAAATIALYRGEPSEPWSAAW